MRAIASSIKSIARYVYVGVAWINLVTMFVVVFIAGMSLFVNRSYWPTHGEVGFTSGLIGVLLIALGLIVWIPRRLATWLAAIFVVHFIQTVLPALKDNQPLIAAVHPLNATLLTWLSLKHAQAAGRLLRNPAAELAAGAQAQA
jgi:hypothetical protein